jgi:hypothetical protein
VRDDLVAGAVLEQDATLVTSDVAVVLGADFTGVHAAASTATTTPGSVAGVTTTTPKPPAPSC